MAIRVELTADEESQLRERAERRGKKPEVLAGELMRSYLMLPEYQPLPALEPVVDETGIFHEDRWQRLMEAIRSTRESAPSLPAEALTREALYSDHD